jgi:pantoate--beta-alanine ligase
MVLTITDTQELIRHREAQSSEVGFVPTMGNLHAGHLSLLEKALQEFNLIYFSIFVNPKQFGPNEDFAKYPRTLEQDHLLIEALAKKYPKCDIIVYAPKDPSEIYPSGYDQSVFNTGMSSLLEGARRPTHFDGVTTVVYRLFELMKPTRAYFGLKDFQQYLIVKAMVKDLQLPIDIKGMPIVRESSGLALSSRNQYLSADDKTVALTLNKTLHQIRDLLSGKRENLSKVHSLITDVLKDQRWNYLELRDSETLSEDLSASSSVTVLGVFQLGTTRLLDNMQLELQ